MTYFHNIKQAWKQQGRLPQMAKTTSAFSPAMLKDNKAATSDTTSLPPSLPHLFIHEDIDDRVDDRARLRQDRRDDAGLGRHQTWRPKGGEQGHNAVRQPAQQVADHHNHHHKQDALLTFPAHRCVDSAHLREGRGRRRGKWEIRL